MYLRFLLIWVVLICSAHALKVEITQGQVQPTPIAITDLYSTDNSNDIGKDIARVVGDDLAASGLFRLIDKSAFIQDPAALQGGPRFSDWRLVNAQFLFSGKISYEGDKVRVDFHLFDVFSGKQLLGLSFSSDRGKWRKMAHMIADAIYKRVTGESGYFDTQIAFIDESGPKGKGRVRRLAVMDWDGENVRYLTNGRHLVVTPRFSPTNLELAYLSFASEIPSVYIYNLATGQEQLLGKFEGMSFAPRFSADGNSIVMSLEKEGASAIYMKNLRNGQLRQLTQHVSIDTSPCFSPDGQNVVFTSDRDSGDKGGEQIFVMDASGANVRRISFGGGKYSQPVWSPRGDWIAFTKQQGGIFYIGVMRPDGGDERLITESYLVEAPVWSSNGRELLFTREKGPRDRSHLCCINLTGHNLRHFKTPRDASDGAWSKLLSEIPG